MASQPPTPHDVEEVQELDIEFDWENETIEQWAYARRDTMTRELFQAPSTGTLNIGMICTTIKLGMHISGSYTYKTLDRRLNHNC